MQRVSLFTSRIALFNATLMIPVLLIVAAVILLTRAGNFPTMGDRVAAASFFCLFSLAAFAIRQVTKRRIERLRAAMAGEAGRD